jgi:hypothetical protein
MQSVSSTFRSTDNIAIYATFNAAIGTADNAAELKSDRATQWSTVYCSIKPAYQSTFFATVGPAIFSTVYAAHCAAQ